MYAHCYSVTWASVDNVETTAEKIYQLVHKITLVSNADSSLFKHDHMSIDYCSLETPGTKAPLIPEPPPRLRSRGSRPKFPTPTPKNPNPNLQPETPSTHPTHPPKKPPKNRTNGPLLHPHPKQAVRHSSPLTTTSPPPPPPPSPLRPLTPPSPPTEAKPD